MEIEQAINLISQVCSQFRGTAQEHDTIRQALIIIKGKLIETEENK